MKYFVTAISILLLAAIAWLIFFSGIVLNREQKEMNNTQSTGETIVVMETTLGLVEITLNQTSAPQTSANFEKLVRQGFYNGLTFHRIIPGFVVQGGDPKGDGTGGPGYTIPAEIKLQHKRGAVAAARLGDQVNPTRASSGSQFYIAFQDLPMLDGQYTVFGQVVTGMDVVDQMAAVKTDAADKPLEPVIINKAYIK
ncbi:MAG: hypothetical protein A3C85_02005 [Candidatus Doudnabacteria bacterium RIFCSPHIGHO2_02_FULL_48_21]|uniref:Peptidyl-prolyl cis-trans isomerase n=1 Tax=Candidatus Doudnabacteria bacterium RIFCSPLOWO2_02_FULL_48_13 TaxID=1817845 RepID=A0A1F5Q8Q5_9BACT|nr:MAG: hypothetical protein A3K05_02210 [Candidatus Doudnabacteria bacterium RIFCSPHIGHO2_01_48_18]OGE79848.1 MAG: hypothetical protein A2668_03770 [Candidatus Doudnabacteria bacterium RIFCSPHIGHO2_01_FULL_48_180]OGE91387.1 MAG: hypothetical protein A3F44_03760 [Candidatus Doudnabacteria bacterium RIFCSPHIGHO2_12_FULL_47_25]OGE93199.1 MAG: hypothetical protein A3C85_02005 [Candidatus Doudnabacteria bacterium RIFCSPHIGHO2_02_FULL_48_21]OGE96720.1 MAG: hypothetical protein A3A83_02880 [Candidatu